MMLADNTAVNKRVHEEHKDDEEQKADPKPLLSLAKRRRLCDPNIHYRYKPLRFHHRRFESDLYGIEGLSESREAFQEAREAFQEARDLRDEAREKHYAHAPTEACEAKGVYEEIEARYEAIAARSEAIEARSEAIEARCSF